MTIAHFALPSGRMIESVKKPAGRTVDFTLSFKPFKLNDLLHLNLKYDLNTSGTSIHSAKLDLMEKHVAEIRGLPLKEPIKFIKYPEPIVRLKMMEEFEKETPPEEMAAYQKIYTALGLIPPGTDLEKTLIDVYTEQIAGFYDPETKVIVLVDNPVSNEALEELTLAHEIAHGIQDQNFGLEQPPLDVETYNSDNDTAVTSLVEGDAESTMFEYAQKYMDPKELAEAAKESGEYSTKELDKAPLYIQRSLMFPYEDGFDFDKELSEKGGEEAVDSAFRDPPLSTKQIMHPEDYYPERENPVPVNLPDLTGTLGEGWKLLKGDTLGEFDIQVWFEDFTGLITSGDVSEGWAGNTVQYYQGPGKKYVLVNATAWETPDDAREFFDAYKELLDDRFGGHKTRQSGDGWYILEAKGELYYCGVSGTNTLCAQARDPSELDAALGRFPQYGAPGR